MTEEIATFNADMLKLARDVREVTQSELAQRSGFTQALVSKLENGLIAHPSGDVVSRLVEVLDFPESFFCQAERTEGFPHFHYRKRTRLGSKALSHINAVINLRRMHVTKLYRSYEIEIHKPIPALDLDNSGLTPEKVAERLRSYWMLPRGPIGDLTRIIEDAGGVVILCRFGTNLLDGISFRSSGLPPIFCMNREMPGDRYRFSLAHELGHMVMHALPDDDLKMEQEAHRFAAAFLMPATDVRAHLSVPKLSALGRAKSFWKVSIKSLIKRAHDLKMITDLQYKYLMVSYSKAFKEGESYPIPIEQPTRLKDMINYHINLLGYTIGDLARLLHLSADETQRAYVGSPNKGLRLVVSN
jgi:Zn-dependent peptidase ImmA (M78 family)/transcriptional regulator with XRE-family HTH domain